LLRDIGRLIDKAEATIEELEKAKGWGKDA
jgi:hypothetical protein